MSNETGITIITPRTLDEVGVLSRTLSKSSLLPDALRGKEAEIMFSILTGAELGLAPMQSIRAIEVIKGKPTLKAEAMVALVRARRDVCEYLMLRHSDAKSATYETKRVGDPSPTTMTFTFAEAQAAGLTAATRNGEPSMWMKYPAAMLRARASSVICKAVYSDILLGVYESDELERPEPPRDVTPPRPTPANVVDSVATVDYAPDGAPVSERAKLEVAIAEAQSEAALNDLVTRITRLPDADKARIRTAWGARRDELKATPKTEEVPS
jgi:hypothetical protein